MDLRTLPFRFQPEQSLYNNVRPSCSINDEQMRPFYGPTNSSILLLLLTFLPLLVTIHLWVCQRWQSVETNSPRLQLPPGSMGWPYIGETLRLYTQNPNTFFATRLKRYGDIFKTHILGCPCVMISSPEAAKSVLVRRAHLFKPTYPNQAQNLTSTNRGGYWRDEKKGAVRCDDGIIFFWLGSFPSIGRRG